MIKDLPLYGRNETMLLCSKFCNAIVNDDDDMS